MGQYEAELDEERARSAEVHAELADERARYAAITSELVQTAIGRNQELLRQEQVRRTNAEAKNGLESFIIDTRDKMSDEVIEQVSTEEEREAASDLESVDTWAFGTPPPRPQLPAPPP